eukprot:CAMPEP_0197387834 /NCGR_PEP_ID=MMETSP1165-20131217/744_1 /TAXON_ID=284809 /ORGANISM="Chrysocystis fragilis, Strain CCMP3189" /LENGTH=62 /DNA_ID=CAMNT_0042913167 /DNA_START=228 /DNA_END=416 /DNA_ORIENTATION=-
MAGKSAYSSSQPLPLWLLRGEVAGVFGLSLFLSKATTHGCESSQSLFFPLEGRSFLSADELL